MLTRVRPLVFRLRARAFPGATVPRWWKYWRHCPTSPWIRLRCLGAGCVWCWYTR